MDTIYSYEPLKPEIFLGLEAKGEVRNPKPDKDFMWCLCLWDTGESIDTKQWELLREDISWQMEGKWESKPHNHKELDSAATWMSLEVNYSQCPNNRSLFQTCETYSREAS